MGVIKSQTIKGSLYSYLGVIVGFFTILYILPEVLTTEQIGLTAILVAISAIYSQFSTLGFTNVIGRMFPYFRNKENGHNGFVFLTLAVGMVGFAISLITFFILKPSIIESNLERSPLLVQFIWFLVPLIFFRMFFLLLDMYNKMLFDATTGTFLSDLFLRIGNVFLLGAFYFKWIDFSQYVLGYVFLLSFPAVYLAGLLIYRKQFSLAPKLDFIQMPLRKEMFSLSAFGLMSGLSAVALKQIDTLFLNEYYDLSVAGIYTISFYFGTIILIPAIAIGKISSTFIADAWKNKDMDSIQDIYYKSSINQLVAALLLFILMVTNLHNIFKILPPEYGGGEWVIVLIALSNLIVSSTGVSVQIIATSHKFKIQTYSMAFLVGLSVILYMIFIPLYGMLGAALVSLFSVSISSLLRVFYLQKYMKLFPYKFTHLKCVAAGLVAFAVGIIIPEIDFNYLDLMVRCLAVSVVFTSGIYFLRVSDDVNLVIDKVLKMIGIIR